MADKSSKNRPPDQKRQSRKRKKARREVSNSARVRSRKDDLLDPTPLLMEAISKGLDSGYAEIDDREVPRADNVVDWLISPEFLNIKPFATQIQDAIHIFTGACYFCSDTEYLVDIPVDEKISNILDRTTLMKKGKCPKCGRRTMEMRHEWCLDPANTFEGYIKPEPPNDACCMEGQRCLVGGTLVLTKTRGLVPIKKIKVGDLVWGPSGWKIVHKRYRFKDKKTRRIVFDDGSFLRGGLKHRVQVITPDGDLVFRRFSEIKEGDWVSHFVGTENRQGDDSLPDLTYIPGPQARNKLRAEIPTQMSSDLARVLGHLTAEGTVTSDYVLKFSNDDDEMHEDYIQSCINVFGIEPKRHPPEFKDSEFCSVEARHWLNQIGLSKSRAEAKSLPWVILRCSPVYQWHFLAALFEGDGSVSAGKVRYHTTSRKLAHNLITLLRSLGFDPSLTTGETKPGSGSDPSKFRSKVLYEVRLAKVLDIERFCRCVPWITSRKGTCARSLGISHKDGYSLHMYPNCRTLITPFHEKATRTIPIQIEVTAKNKASYTQTVHRCVAPQRVRAITRGQAKLQDQFISSVGLHVLADYFGIEELPETIQEILTKDLRFKQVVNIQDTPNADLYDLTVDGHVYWTKGVLSHNSGKSTKTAMYSTWVLHRYLGLANPTKYFGLLEAVGALHGTFVSVTAKQAWENLWQPFSDLIDSSPWFKTYHSWLAKRGQEVGMELYHKPDTYLWYGHKRLAFSFAPADQRTLRGRTRFLSSVDEVGWFGASRDRSGTSRVRADGDGTIRALDRSLATIRNAARERRKRRQNCPDAYQFTISSPSAATDPMMRRFKKAPRSPRMYSVKRATWMSNPTFTEQGLREQEGDVSERDFLCDFACEPPYSDDPWWDNETGLLDICAKKDERIWNGSISVTKDPTSSTNRLRFLYYKFASIVGDMGLPRCLAFDNGEKHNSFAWAIGRFDKQNDTVIAEEVGEVAPGENERIHHGLMWEHVIEPLVQRFRFLHVAWDRWESTRYVADLRTKYRVRAEQYTPGMKDGKNLRSDIANAKLLLPKPECSVGSLPIEDPAALARTPRAHLLLQILTARDGNGLPQKPQGGNDDILRAVLLLDRFIRDNIEDYSRYHHFGGNRCIGIGVGGAIAGGSGRGLGLVVGQGGRALGIGPRR